MNGAHTSDSIGLRAVIVGCGRIAGGFNASSEDQALTHAVAYRRLGIPIVGCCDVDPARARTFAERWGVPRHGVRVEDVLGTAPALVVSVCTPPLPQPEILRAIVAQVAIGAVLLEKPLGATLADAVLLAQQAKAWGQPVLVNYFRAFTPFYQDLEQQLRRGRFGTVRQVTVHYTGTLESHVSHALERLIAAFGAPERVMRLAGEPRAPLFEAWFPGDVRALFVPVARPSYSVFELDVFAERGRLRVVDSERRVEAFVSRPDPEFAGYALLERTEAETPALTYELLGSVAAAVHAARSGRDDSGVLSRALEVAHALERVAPTM